MRSVIFGSDAPRAVLAYPVTQSEAALAASVALPERHPVVAYLAGLSAGSRRTMRGALRTISRLVRNDFDEMSMTWAALDYAHATAVRAHLAETYAPATANRMLAAMRGVIRASFKLGLIDAERMARATSIEPVRGDRLPKGRALSSGEMSALFMACDPATTKGTRDSALLAVLYGCGLRRAEVVALDLADLDANTGGLVVKGKGNKQRRVFVANGARAAVDAWLARRGESEGPLFHAVNKSGRIETRRITDQAVAGILRRAASRAKVSAFSPHDMRRSMISDLLDAGADLATVQQLAGHSSPTTTARYDRRGERARARAASMLHVPFVG